MNHKFDELAKGLAQTVTRRSALKKFGAGLAGIALASLGLAHGAQASPQGHLCDCSNLPYMGCKPTQTGCLKYCSTRCS